MRKSMKTILAALALATPLALTSCEGTLDDVFGEWSRPSGNTNTDPTPAVSNNYMEWDGTVLAAKAIPTTGIQEVTDATTSFEGGFYIVKTDVTIPAPGILINADTKLILCDGATLTVNGYFEDQSSTATYSLTIYGQENETGKLTVNAPDGCPGTTVKDLEIHGGDINIKGATGHYAIYTTGNISIYGGKVTATGGDASASISAGYAIFSSSAITIKGNAVVKAYAGAYYDSSHKGSEAISSAHNIEISDNAEVYATATDGGLAAIINTGDITIKGKKLEATCVGPGAGIETSSGNIEISAGTVTITTGKGSAIDSYADVSISKCTLSATVATAPSVIDAGTNVTIDNDVTKVDLTNSGATSNACNEFIVSGTSVKIGAVTSTTWSSGADAISEYLPGGGKPTISGLSYDTTAKKLTYNPN